MLVATLTYVGYILALIGGILIIVLSLLGLIGYSYYAFYELGALGAVAGAVVGFIIGIICVAGAKYVGHLGRAIALLILGILTFGSGEVLVFIGAIIGLISHATHDSH